MTSGQWVINDKLTPTMVDNDKMTVAIALSGHRPRQRHLGFTPQVTEVFSLRAFLGRSSG